MVRKNCFTIGQVRAVVALLTLAVAVLMGENFGYTAIFLESADSPCSAVTDVSFDYQVVGVQLGGELNDVAYSSISGSSISNVVLSDTLRGKVTANLHRNASSAFLFYDTTALKALDLGSVQHTLAIPDVTANLELLVTDGDADIEAVDGLTSNFDDVSSVLSVTASNQDVWTKSDSLEDAMDYDNSMPNYVASPSLIAATQYKITNKADLMIALSVDDSSDSYALLYMTDGLSVLRDGNLLVSWHRNSANTTNALAYLDNSTLTAWRNASKAVRRTDDVDAIASLLAGEANEVSNQVVMQTVSEDRVTMTENNLQTVNGLVSNAALADKYVGESNHNTGILDMLAVWMHPESMGSANSVVNSNVGQQYETNSLLSDNNRAGSFSSAAPSASDYAGNTRRSSAGLMQTDISEAGLRSMDGIVLNNRNLLRSNSANSAYSQNSTQREVQDLLAGENEISTNSSDIVAVNTLAPKSTGVDTGIVSDNLLNSAVSVSNASLLAARTTSNAGVDVAVDTLAPLTSGSVDELSVEGTSLLALDNAEDSTLLASDLSSYGSTLKLTNGAVASTPAVLDVDELVATEGGDLRIDANFAQENALVDVSGVAEDALNNTEFKNGYEVAENGNLNALLAIDENRIPASEMELLEGADDAFAMLAISDGFAESIQTGSNYNVLDLADASGDTVDALEIGSDAKVKAKLNADGTLALASGTTTFANAIALGSRATLEVLMGGSISNAALMQLKGTEWNSVLGGESSFSQITFLFNDGSVTTSDARQMVTVADANTFQLNAGALNAAVPEPGTWVLMVLGMLGLGWTARRRQNA